MTSPPSRDLAPNASLLTNTIGYLGPLFYDSRLALVGCWSSCLHLHGPVTSLRTATTKTWPVNQINLPVLRRNKLISRAIYKKNSLNLPPHLIRTERKTVKQHRCGAPLSICAIAVTALLTPKYLLSMNSGNLCFDIRPPKNIPSS